MPAIPTHHHEGGTLWAKEPTVRLLYRVITGLLLLSGLLFARTRWTELNIGPFYVDFDTDESAARDVLTHLEQTRWVLAGLLEERELTSVWPIRVLVTRSAPAGFVPQNLIALRGQHLLVMAPGSKVPTGEVAGILLRDNTSRLPPEIESGIRTLFSTLEARGSRVSWGGAPEHPDLDFARMQLFATKFEYEASFHIFLSSLKNGSTLRAAEANAFGQPLAALEREAEERLRANRWEATSVSGRPLDPRRDFGEHEIDPSLGDIYVADAKLRSDPKGAEAVYRAAVSAGGAAAAEGYVGLAQLAMLQKENPTEFLDGAIRANARSAPVYVAAAKDREHEDALGLLKKAQLLNPRWGEPVFLQAELAQKPAEREELLKKVVQLDRRNTAYWIALAHAQVAAKHASAAQGSWLRAEDAAADPAERDRIHQQRLEAEAKRLDALEAERDAEANAAYQADARAQRAEAARIRAAEQRANRALAAQAPQGPETSTPAVPWGELVKEKRAEGTLSQVDCIGTNARLRFEPDTGASMRLLWRDVSSLGLSCGPQKPPVRVSLTYTEQTDDVSSTDGSVSTLRVWRNK